MQALFTPKQTSARMEYLRTSGRLVAKKLLTMLKIALKRLQKKKTKWRMRTFTDRPVKQS
ncbi:MAG: hypothetical protein D8H98_17660 [Prevotella sp.]|nr:MAG: hypothetical protein D8H98_17660 [Prevotella sp.]